MSRWTEATRVSISPIGGNNWKVNEPLYWEVGELDADNEVLEIPIGFVTDLASIPRPFWPIASPHGQPQVQAAIAHDYLYREPDRRPADLQTKRSVDREFRAMMVALGTPWYRVWYFWAAVSVAVKAGEDWK